MNCRVAANQLWRTTLGADIPRPRTRRPVYEIPFLRSSEHPFWSAKRIDSERHSIVIRHSLSEEARLSLWASKKALGLSIGLQQLTRPTSRTTALEVLRWTAQARPRIIWPRRKPATESACRPRTAVLHRPAILRLPRTTRAQARPHCLRHSRT